LLTDVDVVEMVMRVRIFFFVGELSCLSSKGIHNNAMPKREKDGLSVADRQRNPNVLPLAAERKGEAIMTAGQFQRGIEGVYVYLCCAAGDATTWVSVA
jgi:hypothetical protein